MKYEDRLPLLKNFEAAPDSALFSQKTIAALLECSFAKLERDRWEGVGIPYLKLQRAVRYRKIDVLEYLGKQNKMQSNPS